ncbi:hypothetical protein CALVIDRAFT_128733 [Calocera viscosa TUFC12733]|uniref:Fungal pheromone STE3G-protein-coupled receptor n=1 Tax=Calocera viscosa (strain TUFC12733) TaxID=1330018 RepID=A0A167RTE1_CALVF|nr:hypothetical protein CALVIDRAFT_128733 [Calocera viscosa TUFC12733]
MSTPALDGANMIGIFLGSISYGTFLAMSVHLIWRWWRGVIRVPMFLLLAAVAQLLSTTAFSIVFMDYLYEGFVTYRDTVGPVLYYNEDRWQETTISALNIFEQALADGILIYRCWLIWHKSKIILGVTSVPYLAAILCQCLAMAGASPTTKLFDMFENDFATLVHAFAGLSLAQNALTYVLIIGKIWHTARRSTSQYGKTAFTPLIIRLLSMGCIYLCLIILTLVTSLRASGAYVVICHIWSPMSGIVFLSLIVPTKILSRTDVSHELGSPHSRNKRDTYATSPSTTQDSEGIYSVPSEFKVPEAGALV